MDNLSLDVRPATTALTAAVTNSASATTVLWAPTALTASVDGSPISSTALIGTTISYATATTGSCAGRPAHWIATGSDLRIVSATATPGDRTTLEPGQSAQLCLSVTAGDDLRAVYGGRSLTLTTSLDSVAAAPATWTSPVTTWTTVFQVPAAELTPPVLGSCAVVTPNEKAVRITWTWEGAADGWDILQWNGSIWAPIAKEPDPSGNHPAVPATKKLPGDRRTAVIRPGEEARAGDVKVRLFVGSGFVDSTRVFTFTSWNPNNEKVACTGVAPAPATVAAAPTPVEVLTETAVSAPSPAATSPTPSASAAPAPATTDTAAPAAPAPSTPGPAATAAPTATATAAAATDTTTPPATEGK